MFVAIEKWLGLGMNKNTVIKQEAADDYIVVELEHEQVPLFEENDFYIDAEESLVNKEDKPSWQCIQRREQCHQKGDDMKLLCTEEKDQIKEDIELCLVDSAFANIVGEGYYIEDLYTLNAEVYTEEELTAVMDLSEYYISNQVSYAIKLLLVERLRAYLDLKLNVTAILNLTKSVLENIDGQLGYDDEINSLAYNFDNIIHENIFYRDTLEIEFSSLAWLRLNDIQRKNIEVFLRKELEHNFLNFDHFKEVNISDIPRIKFLISSKQEEELEDFQTYLLLSSLELEFSDYIMKNPYLLSRDEFKSCEELTVLLINNYQKTNLRTLLLIFAKEKYDSGQHIKSIFESSIEILKRAKQKVSYEVDLDLKLNSYAFENYFDLIKNKVEFSIINEICMNHKTKRIINKQLQTANFTEAEKQGYLVSKYSYSSYNEYIKQEDFIFKVFNN